MKLKKEILSVLLLINLISFGQSQSLIIKHGNILNMKDSAVLYNYDLWIKDGKIVEINKNIKNYSNHTHVLDVTGNFICPGLIDMHVHIFTANDLLSYLSHGVTTVLNMDGSPNHLKWKSLVSRGLLTGANLFTAGHTLDGVPMLNWMFWGLETAQQARTAVKYQKLQGYDYIKVYGTLNPEVFDALQQEATLQNISVVGHVPRQTGIATALQMNYQLIAHGEDLIESYFHSNPSNGAIDSLAQLLAAKHARITPNLCLHTRAVEELTDLESLLKENENEKVAPSIYSQWIRSNNRTLDQNDLKGYKVYLDEIYQSNIKLTRALHKYGVRMEAGTDAGTNGYPGALLLDEINEFTNAGLSNFEALQTATFNAGIFFKETLHRPIYIGRISVGYDADVLVLEQNPYQNLQNLRSIKYVIQKGRVHSIQDINNLMKIKFNNYPTEKATVDTIDRFFEKNNSYAAIKLIRSSISKTNTPLISQWVIGNKAKKNPNIDQAIDVMRLNILLYPTHFASYNELGKLFLMTNQLDSALKYLEVSLKLAPENAVGVDLKDKVAASRRKFKPLLTGNYLVQKLDKNNNAIDTIYVKIISANNLKEYDVTVKRPESLYNKVSVIGRADMIWFSIPGDFGDTEYSIKRENKELKGRWKSNFGNNGILKIASLVKVSDR